MGITEEERERVFMDKGEGWKEGDCIVIEIKQRKESSEIVPHKSYGQSLLIGAFKSL